MNHHVRSAVRKLSRQHQHQPRPVASTSTRQLVEAAYRPSTISAYKSSVHLFLTWCFNSNQKVFSVEDLDVALADYIHHIWRHGKGKQMAVTTYHGIILYIQQAKGLLYESILSIKGWQKLKPSNPYPPITWELCVLIATQMSRMRLFDYAVGTLLSFDCYLRISEMIGLVVSDVADAFDRRLGAVHTTMALRLAVTKTGNLKWVTVCDTHVIALMRMLIANRSSPSSRLFQFSAAAYRNVLRAVCVSLGLGSIGFVPHSFRHGGATRDFLRGMSLENVLMRGRWESSKSARNYIQAGRALLLAVGVSDSIHQTAHVLARDVTLTIMSALVSF